MPWKLILFLLCLIATTFFIGFNLENTCTINLIFKTYENVPIFLAVLISFMMGVIIAFLFSIGISITNASKKQKAIKEQSHAKQEAQKETAPIGTPPSKEKKVDQPIKKTPLFSKKSALFQKKEPEQKAEKEEQIINLDDKQESK